MGFRLGPPLDADDAGRLAFGFALLGCLDGWMKWEMAGVRVTYMVDSELVSERSTI